MEPGRRVVTPGRLAQGMTFDEYVRFVGTPATIAREFSGFGRGEHWSRFLRERYERVRLTARRSTGSRASPAAPPRC